MTAFADTFPSGPLGDTAFAPTGETYDILRGGDYVDQDAAEAAARTMFDGYASNHPGVLYWRCKPEVTAYGRIPPRKNGPLPVYAFYMRLLISNKEPTP